MRLDGLSTNAGRGVTLESGDRTIACLPEKWLPPLPSHDGSPFFGKCILFHVHFVFLLLMTLTLFSDWDDGGDGPSAPQLRQFDERVYRVCD